MSNSFAAKPATPENSVATVALPATPSDAGLKWLCWALLSSNEFLFVN